MSKATSDQGDQIHRLITSVLIERLSGDEITRGDIDSAIKWCIANGVTAFSEDRASEEDKEKAKKALAGLPHLTPPNNYEEEDDERAAG